MKSYDEQVLRNKTLSSFPCCLFFLISSLFVSRKSPKSLDSASLHNGFFQYLPSRPSYVIVALLHHTICPWCSQCPPEYHKLERSQPHQCRILPLRTIQTPKPCSHPGQPPRMPWECPNCLRWHTTRHIGRYIWLHHDLPQLSKHSRQLLGCFLQPNPDAQRWWR